MGSKTSPLVDRTAPASDGRPESLPTIVPNPPLNYYPKLYWFNALTPPGTLALPQG